MKKALHDFADTEFKRGLLPRTLHRNLDWDSLDWDIYHLTRKKTRSFEYTKVAREVNSTPTTVKKSVLQKIVPKCIQINYFFPKGYNVYKYAFLKIRTDFEWAIVKALEKMPCTSYVYPLEECMIVILFHENIDEVLLTLKKMEKKDTVEGYLLYSPLTSTTNNSI